MASIPYAYVDGSFENGKVGFGGIVVNGDWKFAFFGKSEDPKATKIHNVSGELLAALYATYQLKNKNKFEIYYDYDGVKRTVSGEWKPRSWLLCKYNKLMSEHIKKIKFIKVKSHTGITGNEVADVLSKFAVGAATEKDLAAALDSVNITKVFRIKDPISHLLF